MNPFNPKDMEEMLASLSPDQMSALQDLAGRFVQDWNSLPDEQKEKFQRMAREFEEGTPVQDSQAFDETVEEGEIQSLLSQELMDRIPSDILSLLEDALELEAYYEGSGSDFSPVILLYLKAVLQAYRHWARDLLDDPAKAKRLTFHDLSILESTEAVPGLEILPTLELLLYRVEADTLSAEDVQFARKIILESGLLDSLIRQDRD